MFTTHTIYTSLSVQAEVTPHGIKVHFTELTLPAPRRDCMRTSGRSTDMTSLCSELGKTTLANAKKIIKYCWKYYLLHHSCIWSYLSHYSLTWRSSKPGKIVHKGYSCPCWYRNGGSSGSAANPSTATGWFWLEQSHSICWLLQPQQFSCRQHRHRGSGQNPHSQISYVY